MKVGFQSVGDSDAMLGDDIYVLIDVPGWVDDCALPGLFRAYHIDLLARLSILMVSMNIRFLSSLVGICL